MNWLTALSLSQKVVVGALALAVLYLLGTSFSSENQANKLDLSYVGDLASESSQVSSQIFVHVAGEVKKPGLYAVEVGSRVEDAHPSPKTLSLVYGLGAKILRSDSQGPISIRVEGGGLVASTGGKLSL